jgi:hypothetical protein
MVLWASFAASLTAGEATPNVSITSCKEIDAWIGTRGTALPTLYDDFIAYPPAFRRRMLGHLAPTAQAALWRTQFSRALNTESGLDDEQVRILQEMATRLDTAAYVQRRSPVAEATIYGAFPDRDMLTRLFAQLGPDDSRLWDAQPRADYVEVCWCTTNWWVFDYCSGPTECRLGANDCVYQPQGCGFLGWYGCDGQCCIGNSCL